MALRLPISVQVIPPAAFWSGRRLPSDDEFEAWDGIAVRLNALSRPSPAGLSLVLPEE